MAGTRAPIQAPPGPEPEEPAPGGDSVPPWNWWDAPAALAIALVVAVAISTLVVGILTGAGVDTNGSGKGAANVALTLVLDVCFIGAALLVASRHGRVRARDFGLRRLPLRTGLKWALAAAAAYYAFALVWGQAVARHEKQTDLFKETGVHRGSTLAVLLGVLVCVVAPFAEEFMFRGFGFGALRTRLGVLPSALAVGVAFGAIHATSTPAVLLVQLAFLGFVLCLLRWRTGSLLPCMGVHAANNAIAFASLEGLGWETAPLLLGAVAGTILLALPAAERRRAGRAAV